MPALNSIQVDKLFRLIGTPKAPVIIGAKAEQPIAAEILGAVPGSRDLTGKTSIAQLFALVRGARLAIGNDTGPMHVAAVTGCPTLVLYSDASDPTLCAQRGPRTVILRENRLDQLNLAQVTDAIAKLASPEP
mgnify:CR=1 FL=1